jgi:hypothetical protein
MPGPSVFDQGGVELGGSRALGGLGLRESTTNHSLNTVYSYSRREDQKKRPLRTFQTTSHLESLTHSLFNFYLGASTSRQKADSALKMHSRRAAKSFQYLEKNKLL